MRETSNGVRSMARNLLVFSPKDRIDHAVFGPGTIVEIDERRTTIAFDASGTKKFVTSMVKLSPSDTQAPPRRARSAKKAARSG